MAPPPVAFTVSFNVGRTGEDCRHRIPLTTRALIVVHGAGRNADDYFRTGVAAAFLAGALDDTIVIAPRFASNEGRGCADKLAANEINWRCGGDSWRSGGAAVSDDKINSYDLMDEILRKLARKDVFPNRENVRRASCVVRGYSNIWARSTVRPRRSHW